MSSTSTLLSFLGQDSERRKLYHQERSQFLPIFWDRLSKIDLTSLALEEHNRRTVIHHRKQQPHIPISPKLPQRPPLVPASDYLSFCGTSALQKMKRSAMHGGPDLSDLREFPLNTKQTMSLRPKPRPRKRRKMSDSAPGASTGTSTRPSTGPSTMSPPSTGTPGPYDRNFQQRLIDGGIFPPAYRYPNGQQVEKPDNWDEIKQKLTQSRCSLSPSRFSEEKYGRFLQAEADAAEETQVTASVIPIIEGNTGDGKCVSGGVPFNNLDPLTVDNLKPANPDIYHGARPEQLDRRVRDELHNLIIPTTQDSLPICPNFLVAAKGPDGSVPVAIRQAVYDGAFAARGIDSVKTHKANNVVHENKAHTISCFFNCGLLRIYTVHKHQTNQNNHEYVYVTNGLAGWDMCGGINTFRDGATAFRNARDWAKQQRDEVIEEVNERVRDFQ